MGCVVDTPCCSTIPSEYLPVPGDQQTPGADSCSGKSVVTVMTRIFIANEFYPHQPTQHHDDFYTGVHQSPNAKFIKNILVGC